MPLTLKASYHLHFSTSQELISAKKKLETGGEQPTDQQLKMMMIKNSVAHQYLKLENDRKILMKITDTYYGRTFTSVLE